jgi:hypothetical protein
MIKLLLLLLLFIPLLGVEKVFQLPDHHTRWIYELNDFLKNSTHILIITPSFNHPELKKRILKSVTHGSEITLIVNDPKGDPLSMLQYEHVNLNITPFALTQSVVLIDHSLICTIEGDIDIEKFASKHSPIKCDSDQNKIETIKRSIHPIIKHSKPYLE